MYTESRDEEENVQGKVQDRASFRKGERRKILVIIGVIAVVLILVAFAINQLYWDIGVTEEELKNNYWMTISDEGIKIFDFQSNGDCYVKSLEERSSSFFVTTEEGEWVLDGKELEVTCDELRYKGETSVDGDELMIKGDSEHIFRESEWNLNRVIKDMLEGTEWNSDNGNIEFKEWTAYWNLGEGKIDDTSGLWSIEEHELVLEPDIGDTVNVDIFLKLSSSEGSDVSISDEGVMVLKFGQSDSVTFIIEG